MQGIGGKLLKRAADVGGVAVAEVLALDEQHIDRLALRVDPSLRLSSFCLRMVARSDNVLVGIVVGVLESSIRKGSQP